MTNLLESVDPSRNTMEVLFSVDRGGTFTDVFAEIRNGNQREEKVLKLLSEDPANYDDAPREGIRRIMEQVTGCQFPANEPLDTSNIRSIRMGTTVATNALLERQGEKFALVTTKGFKDILHIGNQSRPNIFDLAIKCPETLYECVLEVDERVLLAKDLDCTGKDIQSTITGERIWVEKAPNVAVVRNQLQKLYAESGLKSVAIVFIHAALFPEHEILVGTIAKDIGFEQVSLSHQVMQMVKMVPRGFTACADAYLTPHISTYIRQFLSGFDSKLLETTQVSFMQSDGGLTPVEQFTGHKAILSGPAGGVVGYAATTHATINTPHATFTGQVVAFDMGGTSTDVSRFAGRYQHVFETVTAGVIIQAPQLDISTVAAGGGSKLTFNSGLMAVGPESVGAHPGPVSYRKGGELAVTDANVVLGRLLPQHFPHIFGPDENQPLDLVKTRERFEVLTADINRIEGSSKSVAEIALGYIKIANEAMCRPIRNLTQMKGFDLTKHTLACFGGAGGQHACSIARDLGIKKVFIHRYSGILSAYGIGLADVVEDVQEPTALVVSFQDPHLDESVSKTFLRLQKETETRLKAQGYSQISFEYFLNIRFVGTDTAMMTPASLPDDLSLFVPTFLSNYRREFGFILPGKDMVVDDIRVRACGHSDAHVGIAKSPSMSESKQTPTETTKVFFNTGWIDTPVYKLSCIKGASERVCTLIHGPSVIIDETSTVVLEPHCQAMISHLGDITIDILEMAEHFTCTDVDPIQLSIFAHRFMGIAEQMGNTLHRTAFSVNIKERLDFSCALFSSDGGLVANAPHIPVHLGAMQAAVTFQKDFNGNDLQEGDVLVSNHPQLAGGSHLPDITVVTPCFDEGEIVFWVASRGHHSDVGGITPGSMPPHSKSIKDEGAAIVSFKLLVQGTFQEEGIRKLLCTPSDLSNPLCSGTRCVEDNLSDLRAQVAANFRGVALVKELISDYTLPVVQAYMHHVQNNAEMTVRCMLMKLAKTNNKLFAEDFMDDGTLIKLAIDIDEKTGNSTFDFTGTGPQVYGNCNAPPAVTYSAIIYCLRSMVAQDIPLNQGCLAPIQIIIPQNSILNPSPDAAVVGGNVLTSQRVVDVILRAFKVCAASQGCMNNLTFGNTNFGYYETIAGGAGAGPSWHGRSGVHSHMTNTRITDPEILERRYPVVLREFCLRRDSGGKGNFHGGDGVIRELEFLTDVTVSILSERRSISPFGMAGGMPGARGQNLLITPDGIIQSLGGKNSVTSGPGTRIRVLSPGGGGYGKCGDEAVEPF